MGPGSRGAPDRMGPLLALASAVTYGIVVPHLSASLEPGGALTTGGPLSRRVHFAAVTGARAPAGLRRHGQPGRRERRERAAEGLLAGVGVGVQYIALAQAGASSGLWPVVAGRVAAVLVLLPGAARHAGRLRMTPASLVQALLVGAGAALGLVLYLLAAHRQMPAVAVVLASPYPALPVVLGLALPHERITPRQTAGLLTIG